MACNVCGCDDFLDFNSRPKIRCASCGSFERSRLLWLSREKVGSLAAGIRVLHVAPERCIYEKILDIVGSDNYHVRDINPAAYGFAKNISRVDLCNLDDLPGDYYDVILHSHVLEDGCCNIAHPLFHLHRALKPSGRHFSLVPFMEGKYDESFQEIGDSERVRRFGQDDHVRRFGRDDIGTRLDKLVRLQGAGTREAAEAFPPELLGACNIAGDSVQSFTPHTVLHLRKNDMYFVGNQAPA